MSQQEWLCAARAWSIYSRDLGFLQPEDLIILISRGGYDKNNLLAVYSGGDVGKHLRDYSGR